MEAREYVLALIKAGMTQSQIEERTGVPQPTVSKIARGEVGDVFSKTYRALQALYEEKVLLEFAQAQQPPALTRHTPPAIETIAKQGA